MTRRPSLVQGQPINRLDGPRLRLILKSAKNLGGDRLAIEMKQAEAALKQYDRVESSATAIQVIFRDGRVCLVSISTLQPTGSSKRGSCLIPLSWEGLLYVPT